MDENDIYWVWFTNIPMIGPVRQHRILELTQDPKILFQMVRGDTQEKMLALGFSEHVLSLLREHAELECARLVLEACNKKKIRIAVPGKGGLPDIFRKYDDLPVVLYVRGQEQELCRGTGVVGARRCTEAGKRAAIELARDAACRGDIVVSGMAKGIDSYAHTCVLRETKGITYAVLGSGVDICYPKEHQRLMDSIEERGLLISEYTPGTPAISYHFPRRNRILAAFSKELYIVDCGNRSGTETTAQAAVRYGVPVKYLNRIEGD